jgi:hypothetical protein
VPKSEWGNRHAAEQYLEKYWLPTQEYEFQCRPVQDQIFIPNKWLPEIIFPSSYNVLLSRGGCLFLSEDFLKLQQCFLEIGDRFIFVVENTFGGKLQEPPLRMKYPADITWEELTSGNYISAMILDSSHKEFYVLGETPAWGRYAASDARNPLDLTGFLHDRAAVFQNKFNLPEQDQQEIRAWLPPVYLHEEGIK